MTVPLLSKKFFMSSIFLLIALDFLIEEGESPGDDI